MDSLIIKLFWGNFTTKNGVPTYETNHNLLINIDALYGIEYNR